MANRVEHLKKVGENLWRLDYRVHGRRKRETVFGSQVLAKEILHSRLTEISEGTWLDRKKMLRTTIGELAQRYCDLVSVRKRGGSREGYRLRNLVRQFDGRADKSPEGKWTFEGGRTLGGLSREAIERWHGGKGQTSPVNADRELALLRHMFSCAVEWKLVRENPARGIRLFKRENRRLRYLTKEQIHDLLKSLKGVARIVVLTALHTGMRKGELLGLRWEDVDWLSGSVHVRKSKNGEDRFVPMDSALVAELKTWFRARRSEFVFTWPNGRRVLDMRETFNSTLSKLKIADFRFHDLRHTFASHFMMSGGDLYTLKEILGHKTVMMTQRYAHLSQTHKREVAKVMDTFWTLPVVSEKPSAQPVSAIH